MYANTHSTNYQNYLRRSVQSVITFDTYLLSRFYLIIISSFSIVNSDLKKLFNVPEPDRYYLFIG